MALQTAIRQRLLLMEPVIPLLPLAQVLHVSTLVRLRLFNEDKDLI